MVQTALKLPLDDRLKLLADLIVLEWGDVNESAVETLTRLIRRRYINDVT